MSLAFCLLLAVSARAGDAPPAEPRPETGSYGAFTDRVRATAAGYTLRSLVGPTDTPLPLALSNLLLDHPDLSAYIVRRHRIAPYRIEMRGPRESWADDGEGTSGLIDLVERQETSRVYYGEGRHRSRFFPVIRAAAVIVMVLEPVAGPGGCARTRSYFRVSLRLKNAFLAGLVKLLRPFLRRTIVSKFSKAFLVADRVGRLMARDPDGVAAEVRGYPDLPERDRADLLALIGRLKDAPPSCSKSGLTQRR